MSVHSRLGGVDRQTLLRGWFLLFIWLWLTLARSGFAPASAASWGIGLFGAALTIVLIYRRNRLAGIVGYLIGLSLAVGAGVACTDSWNRAFEADGSLEVTHAGFDHLRLILPAFSRALLDTGGVFVALAVLVRHFATRHRLMLYGTAYDIDAERDLRRRPGGYYFVTSR